MTLCLCVCLSVSPTVCVHVYACMWKPEVGIRYFPLLPRFLRQGLLLNLEVTNLVSFADQNPRVPHAGITGTCCHTWLSSG